MGNFILSERQLKGSGHNEVIVDRMAIVDSRIDSRIYNNVHMFLLEDDIVYGVYNRGVTGSSPSASGRLGELFTLHSSLELVVNEKLVKLLSGK